MELVALVVVVAVALVALVVVLGLRGQRQLARGAATNIDPFTIGEPWRHVVSAALRSRQQAARAVAGVPAGPLRERLEDIESGLDEALEACWAIARRGHELRRAVSAMDLGTTQQRLDGLAPRLPAAPTAPLSAEELTAAARALDGPSAEAAAARTADALAAKLASGERLRAATARAEGQLRLLGARLDEASARIIELAARPGDATGDLAPLGGDVDSLVQELEAVRQGLEAVDG